jgi:hypothetical protein
VDVVGCIEDGGDVELAQQVRVSRHRTSAAQVEPSLAREGLFSYLFLFFIIAPLHLPTIRLLGAIAATGNDGVEYAREVEGGQSSWRTASALVLAHHPTGLATTPVLAHGLAAHCTSSLPHVLWVSCLELVAFSLHISYFRTIFPVQNSAN